MARTPSAGSASATTAVTRRVMPIASSAGTTIAASATDWQKPAAVSFATVRPASRGVTWPLPSARITADTVWPPELPPWPISIDTKKVSSISSFSSSLNDFMMFALTRSTHRKPRSHAVRSREMSTNDCAP